MHHCNTDNLLVGTKVDLRSDPNFIQSLKDKGLRAISNEQGAQLGQEIKAIKYMECSALTQVGLKEVFDFAIKTVLVPKGKGENMKKKGGCTLF